MFKKGTKAYSIFNMKCPRCHEGDLFPTGSFSFNKPFDMPETCPKCGQKYFLGPGFYYGAMFISYIITGFFCLFVVGGLILFAGLSINAAFMVLLVVIAILFVWFFRISRAIWININVRYNANALSDK
ncbi:MAG: DUF983 domain-containing protein [Saprospiraceae bacterium]|nr:DUF983 domain-containing protein [Saprospiraceae bacterium]